MITFTFSSKHIVFWTTLILGIGLCIGGIYMPALMVPGAMLVSSSLAFYQSSWAAPEVDVPISTPEVSPMLPMRTLEPINVTNNYMIFSNGAHLSRSRSGHHIELSGGAGNTAELEPQHLSIHDEHPTL